MIILISILLGITYLGGGFLTYIFLSTETVVDGMWEWVGLYLYSATWVVSFPTHFIGAFIYAEFTRSS